MAISPLGKDQIIQNNKNNFDSGKQTDKGISFEDAFGSIFNEINELQTKTNDSIEHLSTGKVENIHEVMVAMSKAEASFKYMMEARNKLAKTYIEVMKHQ